MLCAVNCSGGWRSNTPAALLLGNPFLRVLWDLRSRCKEEWFRLLRPLQQRFSASDSNFRCRREEWFRLLRPLRQRSAASDSNFRRRKEEWFRLQAVTTARLH